MKTCTRCGIEKTLDEYHIMTRSRDGRKQECKVCHNARVRATTAENARWLLRQRAVPCADCGRDDLPPNIMEFDHVFAPKEEKMSRLLGNRKRLEAEVRKCEIRCPTCHRLRHHLQGMRGPAFLDSGSIDLGASFGMAVSN